MFRVDFGVRHGSVLSRYLFALYLDDLSGLCLSGCTIILYADDIMLISPSICRLEKLLHICKKEPHWLEVAINFKKSCRLRIGSRYDTHCMNLRSMTGSTLLYILWGTFYCGQTLQMLPRLRQTIVPSGSQL